MRTVIIHCFFILLLAPEALAQDSENKSPGYLVWGFGGQSMVSIHYEGNIINGAFGRFSLRGGGGLNENGDDETGEYAVYCLIPELIGTFGKGSVQLEAGASPTAYFHKGTSFVNVHGLCGLRIGNARKEDFFVSLDYFPRLYSTSNNEAIQRIDFGIRIGVNVK